MKPYQRLFLGSFLILEKNQQLHYINILSQIQIQASLLLFITNSQNLEKDPNPMISSLSPITRSIAIDFLPQALSQSQTLVRTCFLAFFLICLLDFALLLGLVYDLFRGHQNTTRIQKTRKFLNMFHANILYLPCVNFMLELLRQDHSQVEVIFSSQLPSIIKPASILVLSWSIVNAGLASLYSYSPFPGQTVFSRRNSFIDFVDFLIKTILPLTKLANRNENPLILWIIAIVLLSLLATKLYIIFSKFPYYSMKAYRISLFFNSLQACISFAMEVAQKTVSLQRIHRLLQSEEDRDEGRRLVGPIRSLRLRNVSFAYPEGNGPALSDVDLSIPIGSKMAFAGYSGSGKSTIAKLLLRFYEPTSGEIVVNGLPLHSFSRDDWHRRVCVVAQEPCFLPDTIRANLLFGLEGISDERILAICEQMQIAGLIRQLPQGLDTPIGDRGITLSGGERQRLAIVRALLRDPDILIPDESTSALDPDTEMKLMTRLDEIRQGRTTIVIAHRLSTVAHADEIVVLDRGVIVERGTHRQLLAKNGAYAELWRAQNGDTALAWAAQSMA